MAKKNYPETGVLSGFMELLPEDQIEFDKIKDTVLEVYESFGFTALDTPVMERMEILRAKNVGETENTTLIYDIKHEGNKEIGLRFDLTVPLARYVADHFGTMSFPFRRCHIAKVYRRERAQKGRFREFYQCDIDVIGSNGLSIRYDAEIPSVIFKLFKKLDFGKFTIRVNNRKLINGFIESLGCTATTEEVLAVIDRIEKVEPAEFIANLGKIGLNSQEIEAVTKFCGIKGSNEEVLKQLKDLAIESESFVEGLTELATVADFMKALSVDEAYYKIDPTIVRGLDYYTGTVYETILDDHPEIGSVCSGGRYDNLAEAYTKEKLPGVGISIGLTRLFHQLKGVGIIKGVKKTIADVIIIPREDNNILCGLSVGQLLREEGFKVDALLETQNMKKKLNYVGRKDTQFTIVIGDDEEKDNNVNLQYKDSEGNIVKETVAVSELVKAMKNIAG